MAYSVKEIFYTLQGEGHQSGRPAVFCRFAGCNLWSGREQDRSRATCTFCDTDFRRMDGPGGGRFLTAQDLAAAIIRAWRGGDERRFVVLTGGEPLLQVDSDLIEALHQHAFEIAVETNGTLPAPEGLDWIAVSPKANAPLRISGGDELKLVYPQSAAPPERFAHLAFAHFLLQPLDGPNLQANTAAAVSYCLSHPQWRLSLQSHKFAGIP